MKYMKLGIHPDTFYTEEATRSVLSDVPSDLIIQINNTRYGLHKFPLLLKCGLLQCFCSDTDDSGERTPVVLHGIPGGEEAFELCAKFCYGITINLSAHNFVAAICAAKFLRMTESISKGNFVMKLETFFDSCVLHGWKDPIVLLQTTTGKLATWSKNLGLVHRCIEAIVEKILMHPSKVTWSYTYTRPGYAGKSHRSVPKDWWTEDVSDLDLDVFRSIISTVRSAKELPPQLIGEALHVYACKHLPDQPDAQATGSSSAPINDDTQSKYRRVLESIVSMIPSEFGSVSGHFLLRLLKVANTVDASPSTKAELVRRSGRQLHEATVSDLLFASSLNPQCHDIDLVEEVLEVFLAQFRRPLPQEDLEHMIGSIRRVAMIIDSYLQKIAHNADIPVLKFVNLAESLPELARPEHDEIYKAIDVYLKEHPEISKEEKKQLCRMLDCRKLSGDARSHAIRNDRLPLRTIVQVLFTEQGQRAAGAGTSHKTTNADAAGVNKKAPAIGNHNETPQNPQAEEERQREIGPPVAKREQSLTSGRIGKSKSASETKVAKKKEKEVINDVLKSKSMPK